MIVFQRPSSDLYSNYGRFRFILLDLDGKEYTGSVTNLKLKRYMPSATGGISDITSDGEVLIDKSNPPFVQVTINASLRANATPVTFMLFDNDTPAKFQPIIFQVESYEADTALTGTKPTMKVSLIDNSINTSSIANGALTNAKFADGALTAAKFGNNCITAAKINDGALTAAKFGSACITSSSFAAGAITSAVLANDAITSNKLQNNAITAAKITDGSFTATKFGDYFLTNTKVDSSVIHGIAQEVLDSYIDPEYYGEPTVRETLRRLAMSQTGIIRMCADEGTNTSVTVTFSLLEPSEGPWPNMPEITVTGKEASVDAPDGSFVGRSVVFLQDFNGVVEAYSAQPLMGQHAKILSYTRFSVIDEADIEYQKATITFEPLPEDFTEIPEGTWFVIV